MASTRETSNNGQCTCGLIVERLTTGQKVECRFHNPIPIVEGHLDFYDKAPKLKQGVHASIRQDGIEKYGINPIARDYFGYGNFDHYPVSQANYGETSTFTMSFTCIFSMIQYTKENGETVLLQNHEVQVSDTCVFRQACDTESWGSEEQVNLFIPWQDVD